jgi:hypothetical protein
MGQGELLSCHGFASCLHPDSPLIVWRATFGPDEEQIPPPSPNLHLIVAPDANNSQIITACLFVVAIGHDFVTRSVHDGRRKKGGPSILLANIEQPNRLHLSRGPQMSIMDEVVIAGRAPHSPSASCETRDVMGACPTAASRTAGDPSCCFLPGTSLPLFCIQRCLDG